MVVVGAELEKVDPLREELDNIDEVEDARAVTMLKAIVGNGMS